MKLRNVVGGIAAVMMGLPGAAKAAEVVKSDDVSVNVGGRLQMLGFGQRVDDPDRSNGRMYLFMKQARLNLSGDVKNWRYRAEVAFGGEVPLVTTTGVALDLLDLWLDAPLPLANTYIRAGQFKTLYSRERLTDSGDLLFADRSVQNMMFRQGRDVGVVLHSKMGPVVFGAGVGTGGGISVPQRYLPQIMGTPMVQARLGLDFGTNENAFTEKDDRNAKVEKLQGAFFVNGFYMKDSMIGHSTVLTTKFSERPLLINVNWNPYLAQAPRSIGTLQQFGFDGVVASPAGAGVVSAEVEGNYGAYKNDYGEVSSLGGRVQLAYALNAIPLTIAGRYSAVLPSENFKSGAYELTKQDGGWSEVTPSLTYQLAGKKGGFNARLVADLPIQLNTPVVREKGIGAYLLAEQPDQASYMAKADTVNTVSRQTVIEARMMLQAEF